MRGPGVKPGRPGPFLYLAPLGCSPTTPTTCPAPMHSSGHVPGQLCLRCGILARHVHSRPSTGPWSPGPAPAHEAASRGAPAATIGPHVQGAREGSRPDGAPRNGGREGRGRTRPRVQGTFQPQRGPDVLREARPGEGDGPGAHIRPPATLPASDPARLSPRSPGPPWTSVGFVFLGQTQMCFVRFGGADRAEERATFLAFGAGKKAVLNGDGGITRGCRRVWALDLILSRSYELRNVLGGQSWESSPGGQEEGGRLQLLPSPGARLRLALPSSPRSPREAFLQPERCAFTGKCTRGACWGVGRTRAASL